MAPPPKKLLADFARGTVERHGDDWDGLHAFEPLHWDGQQIRVETHAAIDPRCSPEQYPQIMAGLMAKEMEEQLDVAPTLYGLMLMHEGYRNGGAPLTREQQRELDADVGARRVHTRPDAVEFVVVYVVDVHGRVFIARRDRGAGRIEEEFLPPGVARRIGSDGGMFLSAMLSIACGVGAALYGLPRT